MPRRPRSSSDSSQATPDARDLERHRALAAAVDARKEPGQGGALIVEVAGTDGLGNPLRRLRRDQGIGSDLADHVPGPGVFEVPAWRARRIRASAGVPNASPPPPIPMMYGDMAKLRS